MHLHRHKRCRLVWKNTPSPSFSINPSIFGFLKSLDLRSVNLNPNMVTLVHLIAGWEIVVYDPVVAKSRLRGNEVKSVGESKDYDVEHVDNEFAVEDADDSDEDEPILRFKRIAPTKSENTHQNTLQTSSIHETYSKTGWPRTTVRTG